MGYTFKITKKERKGFPNLTGVYVSSFYHIPTATNQIIWIHQTVMMLKARQTYLLHRTE